jgi:esterase/lipase superfamily enzyme
MAKRLVVVNAIASALCSVATLAMQAPTTSSLTGLVRDSRGNGIPGATLTLACAWGERTVVTDSTGRYFVPDVFAGQCSLKIAVSGFGTQTQDVTLVTGSTVTANVTVPPLTYRAAPPPVSARPPTAARPPATAAPPPPSPPAAADPATHANVTVYFATDRERSSVDPLDYAGRREASGTLQFGEVDVHIPREHRLGHIERPTIWTLWHERQDKDFVITRAIERSAAEFYTNLSATIAASAGKQAFVFVHGFNVTFRDAVYRTAQLAYDLEFDGAPILYTWPSTADYPVTLNNNDWTVAHLKAFLDDVSARTGATTIHLIAHSMGNRALVNALRQMTPVATGPRFTQLALTAPDIDAGVFEELAAQFRPLVARATLYASSNDLALKASKAYQGYQRAGDTQPTVIVVPGIDTIDVSAVDTDLLGHSYYGDNQSVISDLFYLFEGVPPGQRTRLRTAQSATGSYWTFQP